MPRCSGAKPDGTPCQRIVSASREVCFAHDPSKAAQRSKAASKAGSVKTVNAEVTEIKAQLRGIMGGVMAGEKDRARASVAAQVAGVLVRYYELERRIKADEELERRIAELEELAAGQGQSYHQPGAANLRGGVFGA